MTRRFDVIVLGLGVMGTLASYCLARRGVRVLGLDRYDIPNAMGSSSGLSRMVRKIYHEHEDYIDLLEEAYRLWNELELESGQMLLHLTGGLYMGEPEVESIRSAIAMAERRRLAHEVLDRQRIGDRYPQFRIPDNFVGLFEPTAGWIAPERSVMTAAHQAMLHGAELHGQEAVLEWSTTATGVRCTTSRGSYDADQLIVCAGPWLSELVPELKGLLQVTRQVTAWVWPRKPGEFTPDRFPCWSVRKSDNTRLYGFPLSIEGGGLKVANHERSFRTDVNSIPREALPTDEATFRTAFTEVLPDASGPLLSLRTCMYTNTPDYDFLVGRHPRQERVWLAGGFSGHGFKMASVIGAILADFVLAGKTSLPIGFLSPERFR